MVKSWTNHRKKVESYTIRVKSCEKLVYRVDKKLVEIQRGSLWRSGGKKLRIKALNHYNSISLPFFSLLVLRTFNHLLIDCILCVLTC